MASDSLCFKTKIVHYSNIDIYGLIKEIPKFFKAYHYDFWEKGHAEKPDGVGHTIDSEWNAVRDINDYLRFKISLRVWVRDLRKVVFESGESTYYGKITIFLKGEMTKDYKDTLKSKDIIKKLYERYVRKQEIDDYEDKLADECVDFTLTLRSFFR